MLRGVPPTHAVTNQVPDLVGHDVAADPAAGARSGNADQQVGASRVLDDGQLVGARAGQTGEVAPDPAR